MPNVGELSDVLRALGRMLDQQRATHIEITNHDTFLRVTWENFTGGGEQECLEDVDLNELREQARAMRQGTARSPGGTLAEMLRTLGQELDREMVDVATITQERGSFKVSGQSRGHYFREVYHEDQLVSISWQRRATRKGVRPSWTNRLTGTG